MIELEGFRRSPCWAFAALAAFFVCLLSSHNASFSYAADATPPAVESKSAGESDDGGTQSDSNEDEEDSSVETDEEKVAEEEDGEVEVDPGEEDDEEPPADDDQEAEEDAKPPKQEKRVIGATANVLEKQSNLLFRARVDTGAKSCSLHVEELSIVEEEERWVDNIGKVVRFKVKNRNDESHWLEARIDGYVIIKTSESRMRRYKVPLTLRWKGVEKSVLVTLNDRNGMEYPLLLGRNFLRGDFVVDVDVDHDD